MSDKYQVIVSGTVMKVYADSKKGTPKFDVYVKASGSIMPVNGNGVKEGDQFNGPVDIGMMNGVSKTKEGKDFPWAFMTFDKVEVSAVKK